MLQIVIIIIMLQIIIIIIMVSPLQAMKAQGDVYARVYIHSHCTRRGRVASPTLGGLHLRGNPPATHFIGG